MTIHIGTCAQRKRHKQQSFRENHVRSSGRLRRLVNLVFQKHRPEFGEPVRTNTCRGSKQKVVNNEQLAKRTFFNGRRTEETDQYGFTDDTGQYAASQNWQVLQQEGGGHNQACGADEERHEKVADTGQLVQAVLLLVCG